MTPPPPGPLWIVLLSYGVFGLGALLLMAGSGLLPALARRVMRQGEPAQPARGHDTPRRPRPRPVLEEVQGPVAPISILTGPAIAAHEALRRRLDAARAAREEAGISAHDAALRQSLADRRAVDVVNEALARHGRRRRVEALADADALRDGLRGLPADVASRAEGLRALARSADALRQQLEDEARALSTQAPDLQEVIT